MLDKHQVEDSFGFLDSIFTKTKRTIDFMQANCELYTLHIDSDSNILTENPHKYVATPIQGICPERKIFDEALSLIVIHAAYGELYTRNKVLLLIACEFSPRPFVIENGKVGIPVPKNEKDSIHRHMALICTYFYETFGVSTVFSSIPVTHLSVLTERSADAQLYYLRQHGEWTMDFMKKMGDDLSRQSFSTFLRQRISAHIFENSLTCYPVKAPAQSARWRRQRENETYDFPVLDGCRDDVRDFFYRDTFIYEQYAICSVVEAKPGDTVIDAGAYIGDTACYFSRKVGRGGRVFAFEIVPESVIFAQKNMNANDCSNVEVVPLALADSQGVFSLAKNTHCDSGTVLCALSDDGTEEVTVHAVTLDDFLRERRCGADFIKADIEGAEMSMLRGAKETISKYAPTCAISLYHKPDDYWEIPQLLAEFCPNYTFWFRCEAEPVLFAAVAHNNRP